MENGDMSGKTAKLSNDITVDVEPMQPASNELYLSLNIFSLQ